MSPSIVSRLSHFLSPIPFFSRCRQGKQPPDLHSLWLTPSRLPGFVRHSPVAMRYLDLLGPLAWDLFPERNLQRNWGRATVPLAAFAAACLVKIDQQIGSLARLRAYLVEHPPLAWLLGFPLPDPPTSSAVQASLPTQRHFTRMLRNAPNSAFQFLLDSSVAALRTELQGLADPPVTFGETIALDTKHIIAFVKENNPKAYFAGKRYDKTQQPSGDPDCKLGCKRRKNQLSRHEASAPPTPTTQPIPAGKVPVDQAEYYWGYGSGVVATRVPGWGEFILAELTQTFDQADVSYFFPLMAEVERRLGFRPQFGALDAAFDAFYIYEYFHRAGGFAAVPLVEKGKTARRTCSPEGLPLCAAGLAMPLKMTYQDRTTALIPYERGRYVCPLHFPQSTGQPCPQNDPHWSKQGCVTTLATSIGARIRHQLDREGAAYKAVYKQRTADERINSQAKALGIERPILRNGQAIANLNTLIYVLINLRALQRIMQQKAQA